MRSETVHEIVVAQSSQQAGCVSRKALLDAGVSCGELATLLRERALLRISRGVYLYGARTLSVPALWWSALLIAGVGGRLSRRSALEAHGALAINAARVVVVHPRRNGHGTRTFRSNIPSEDGTYATIVAVPTKRSDGYVLAGAVPTDSVLRAIDDLAADGETRELRRAWREAEYRGLLRREDAEAHLRAGSPGADVITELLEEHPLARAADVELLSHYERDLLEGLIAAGLPSPAVNRLAEFGGRMLRPDFWFAFAKLVVEADGPAHRFPARRIEDAERDRHFASLGIEVLRFTDVEIRDDLEGCVRQIAARLSERVGVAA